MQTLTVSLKIPFESDPPIGLSSALIFSHWLPIGRDQGIFIEEESRQITLWFDEKCSWFASQPTADELTKYVNVHTRHVYAEVVVSGLSDDFLSYVRSCNGSQSPDEVDAEASSEYECLAKQVLTATVHRVNRLVAYARAHKGQYWLTESTLDFDRLRSYCNEFEARGQIGDGPLFRFCPPTTDCIRASFEAGRTYIVEDDWPALRDFVVSSQKATLVGELLAGAEYLLHFGHCRSAVTEAVTALEVAIFSFSRAPNAEAAFGSKMADRLALSTLQSQVQHLGLSTTIGYLLPTIIPESLLSAEVLKGCQAALTQRQNVVHNGQRNVKDAVAKKAIADIRACCTALETMTVATSS